MDGEKMSLDRKDATTRRVIKYRARRLSDGSWVYGFYSEGSLLGEVQHYITVDRGEDVLVDPLTVGQLVREFGGAELYEDDILDVWHEDDVDPETDAVDPLAVRRALVRWGGFDYPAFDIQQPHTGCRGQRFYASVDDEWNTFSREEWDWKVVGNIHENPELLPMVGNVGAEGGEA